MQNEIDNRPTTPESPLAGSLYHASTTVDDLTMALANFSRVTSPEPPFSVTCCCGNDDCDNAKAWLTFKSKLEERLVLSAEVGQALLQKHEAYVRQHERRYTRRRSVGLAQAEPTNNSPTTQDDADALIDELTRENAVLEKRLNQALVNNEVAEVSNKTVLHELQEARATIVRLTAHHARSIGWDTRLMAVIQERDDMQQERDIEAQKASQAESRIASLKTRTAKLESEVQHLRGGLEEQRTQRLESSESIIQDARARLEVLQNAQLGRTAAIEETEIMKVLESLVQDNEGLKQDTSELQRLLTEAREDYHTLQEEIEEQRANRRSISGTSHLKSLFLAGVNSQNHNRNDSSDSRYRRPFESLITGADRRPLHSPTSSETKWTSLGQPLYPDSQVSAETDEEGPGDGSPEKTQRRRRLFLLSRSCGVQTDAWPEPSSYLMPLPLSSSSTQDPRSESSSLTDSLPSNMSILVERVTSLLQRMTQADALTLTNRLKRQNLKGADVSHLSRTTVSGIVAEVGGLRTQFRALLEDEKIVTTCTRKDLRSLLKFLKDGFVEMGQMRVTLNDVILDPSSANKLREVALNPSKREHSDPQATGGWMAPISKLFSSSMGEGSGTSHDVSAARQADGRGRSTVRPRIIPKLGPALSASATTVNVEFSGSGVGRAVTSTLKAREGDMNSALLNAASNGPYHTSTNVMGIFAGAPRKDSWVVLPKDSLESPPHSSDAMSPVFAKPSLRGVRGMNRLSRHVDAVIDASSPRDEGFDYVPPLLQRTLHRRGLSDSSIHSTFVSQATNEPRAPPPAIPDGGVIQALSKTVKNFRFTTSGQFPTSNNGTDAGNTSSSQQLNTSGPIRHNPRVSISSPLGGLIPKITSWANTGVDLDLREPFYGGGRQSESVLSRTHGGDYI